MKEPVTRTLIRPWPVLKAQFKLFMLGLSLPHLINSGRTITYMESDTIGPFVTRRHYVQIGTESGRIFYATPHMTAQERLAFVRRINSVRDFYNSQRQRCL
jgi:hypothetical protein